MVATNLLQCDIIIDDKTLCCVVVFLCNQNTFDPHIVYFFQVTAPMLYCHQVR